MAEQAFPVEAIDWKARAEDLEVAWVEEQELRAAAEIRVARLEAALVASNKTTYTPKQQGEIARRALSHPDEGKPE